MASQKINKNSKGIQAGRDVNIGLSYSDVKAIFYDLLKQNFPQLIQEASQNAIKNVDDYMKDFEKYFRDKVEQIDINKFKDPNTQFLLSSSVSSIARKGRKIDYHTMSELILTAVKKDTNNVLEIVTEEAISVLPKLTKEHISILTMIQFLLSMKIDQVTDLSQIEGFSKVVLDLSQHGFDISQSSIMHLTYLGVISISQFRGINMIDILKNNYPFLSSKSNDDIQKELDEKTPSLKKLIKIFNKNNMRVIGLTTVGQLIALVNIGRIIPGIDYKIWIN